MFVSQFVYCIISDHTDGTAVQRATNNVDACTQCAYLFLFIENARNICRCQLSIYNEFALKPMFTSTLDDVTKYARSRLLVTTDKVNRKVLFCQL